MNRLIFVSIVVFKSTHVEPQTRYTIIKVETFPFLNKLSLYNDGYLKYKTKVTVTDDNDGISSSSFKST